MRLTWEDLNLGFQKVFMLAFEAQDLLQNVLSPPAGESIWTDNVKGVFLAIQNLHALTSAPVKAALILPLPLNRSSSSLFPRDIHKY